MFEPFFNWHKYRLRPSEPSSRPENSAAFLLYIAYIWLPLCVKQFQVTFRGIVLGDAGFPRHSQAHIAALIIVTWWLFFFMQCCLRAWRSCEISPRFLKSFLIFMPCRCWKTEIRFFFFVPNWLMTLWRLSLPLVGASFIPNPDTLTCGQLFCWMYTLILISVLLKWLKWYHNSTVYLPLMHLCSISIVQLQKYHCDDYPHVNFE